jgi:hypothetical protein
VGRIVEIGSLREPVEILDEPCPAPEERIGRIKHGNGENVDISFDTLQELMAVAREVRRGARTMEPAGRRHRQESFFPA